MKVLVVTSSPNADGLTAACGEVARQGIVDGGSRARVINLNDCAIERCAVCNNGWGPCLSEHRCALTDDLARLQDMFAEAEAYVWLTPVYFGDPSEPMKALFDRLRRCEATKPKGNALSDKPTICVAVAGGSGSGAVHCLSHMERWIQQLGATTFDLISVTQKTREYQLETIHDALVAMCAPKPKEQQPVAPGRRRRPPRRRFKKRRSEAESPSQ
jgi:multimeric flavodoxin WrbA